MLFAHFTNEESANNLKRDFEDGTIKLPLFITTNLILGTTYGKNFTFFKVNGDFESEVGFVGQGNLTNKKADGCIEYVIKTKKQLISFMNVIESIGVSHAMNIDTYIKSRPKKEQAIHNGYNPLRKSKHEM